MKDLNITLKNVKFSEFASQETFCFEAKIYLDGKAVAEVSNSGTGGCNNYGAIYNKKKDAYEHASFEKLAKAVNKNDSKFIDTEFDYVVSDLFLEWIVEKDLKKLLKKPALFDVNDNEVRTFTGKVSIERARKYVEDKDNLILLNDLAFENALRFYKKTQGL